MAGFSTGSRLLARAVLAISLAAGGTAAMPAPVEAQGLFDLFGSIFRGVAPRAYRGEPPRLLENFPGRDGYEEQLSGPGGPHVSYCVRLCDGRYFPMPATSRTNDQQMCRAICPAAQTKVFAGSQIERASASDGQRYSSLPTALAYREKMVSDCTCNGRDTAGVAQLDPLDDPTLRPGDIVVTAEGAKVFTGNRRGANATAFVPAEKARGLSPSLRKELSDMRIAPERLAATVTSGAPAAGSVGAPANPALTMTPDGGDAQSPETRQN